MKPLVIDLYCGLGGWSEGFLAEGYECIGFDIERHRYPSRDLVSGSRKVQSEGVDFNNPNVDSSRNRSFNYANQCAVAEAPLTGYDEYPGRLVLQDILTIHGSQFKAAACIVASPPCQEYSWMAMPWSLAKKKAAAYRSGELDVTDLNRLFDACFRIQREACEAAGHHIPMIVENVRGAQPWIGRSRWHYGSFHLWGDVPALMPITLGRVMKQRGSMTPGVQRWCRKGIACEGEKGVPHAPTGHWTNPAENGQKNPGFRFDGSGRSFQSESVNRQISPGWRAKHYDETEKMQQGTKHGGDCFSDPTWPGRQGGSTKQPGISGPRDNGKGDRWFQDGAARSGSKSNARKAASAQIAKIPFALSRHIARCFKP